MAELGRGGCQAGGRAALVCPPVVGPGVHAYLHRRAWKAVDAAQELVRPCEVARARRHVEVVGRAERTTKRPAQSDPTQYVAPARGRVR